MFTGLNISFDLLAFTEDFSWGVKFSWNFELRSLQRTCVAWNFTSPLYFRRLSPAFDDYLQAVDIITSYPDHDIVISIDSLGKEDLLLYISEALNIKVCVITYSNIFLWLQNAYDWNNESLTHYRFGYGQNDCRSCIYWDFMKFSRPGHLLLEFGLFLVTVLGLKLLKRWMNPAQP